MTTGLGSSTHTDRSRGVGDKTAWASWGRIIQVGDPVTNFGVHPGSHNKSLKRAVFFLKDREFSFLHLLKSFFHFCPFSWTFLIPWPSLYTTSFTSDVSLSYSATGFPPSRILRLHSSSSSHCITGPNTARSNCGSQVNLPSFTDIWTVPQNHYREIQKVKLDCKILSEILIIFLSLLFWKNFMKQSSMSPNNECIWCKNEVKNTTTMTGARLFKGNWSN